ncbi:MAG TPA: site-specific integrase [Actinobacteria bacterium]|nr:site-specific integrase [Actinomycetota bacterium]
MSIERIERKGKEVAYLARWRDETGRQRARTFTRKVDASAFLSAVKVDTQRGTYVDHTAGRETIEAYAPAWAAAQPWRPQTRERMRHVINSQIVPRFGTMQLRAVRPSAVQAWVGEMTSSGLAPSTVEGYYRVLAAVMLSARRDRLIAESPTDGVRLPRAERSAASLVPLSVEQVRALSDAVPSRYRALVIASAGLGLRQGEACGLTVDRVDFLRRQVRIDRQLVTPPGVGAVRFGPPKTTSSNRVLTLPDVVGEVLSSHIAQYGAGVDGLLFTSSTGAPLRRSTWADAFRRATRDTGVSASSHDLRHHCASLLISAGCSVKAVQAFLGHKNASETLDTYGHLWPGDEDRIRAAIDAGLRGNVHGMCTDAASEAL